MHCLGDSKCWLAASGCAGEAVIYHIQLCATHLLNTDGGVILDKYTREFHKWGKDCSIWVQPHLVTQFFRSQCTDAPGTEYWHEHTYTSLLCTVCVSNSGRANTWFCSRPLMTHQDFSRAHSSHSAAFCDIMEILSFQMLCVCWQFCHNYVISSLLLLKLTVMVSEAPVIGLLVTSIFSIWTNSRWGVVALVTVILTRLLPMELPVEF